MRIGLDVFLEQHAHKFKGERIGLLTNMTGVNRHLIPTIDLFHEHPDLQLTALFGPEHGIRGDGKETEEIESGIDPYTGLPVFSLYGKTKKPTVEMLDRVDMIVCDLQDIGSRYYTFISTMAYMMEVCGKRNKPFAVLDRPNPLGGLSTEGNLVEPGFRSFYGLYPIPIRHGLTIGELALLFVHEFGISCEVTIMRMEGWRRDMYFDQTGLFWVAPSPNATGLDMCMLCPGTGLVEGTNLSEGRGTTQPFEIIGAPYIEGYQLAKRYSERAVPGVLARPVSFVPTYQKYRGERCEGIQLHVENRQTMNALQAGLILLETVAELYPGQFSFQKSEGDGENFFDLLAGTDSLRRSILSGDTASFLDRCVPQLEQFDAQVKPYLLYD